MRNKRCGSIRDQLQLSFFDQNDWEVTPQLTLMLGLRYDVQSNMQDPNNLDPRLGFAYAPGRATVIRGGGGILYLGMPMNAVEDQRRLDGTQADARVTSQCGEATNSPRHDHPIAKLPAESRNRKGLH